MIFTLTPSRRSSFGTLAKGMSAWTSNGLLTVLVLVGGVVLGRQVLTWWAADMPQSAASLAAALPIDKLGHPRQGHTIQFGSQSWSLYRQSVTGNKRSAEEQLRAACRELLQSSRPADVPPGNDIEFRTSFLLASNPIDEEPDKWRMYALDETFPMVVGTARVATSVPKPTTQQSPPAASQYCVVLWGLAIPTGFEGWTLCIFRPQTASTEKAVNSADIPLPPKTHQTLSLEVSGRERMVGFRGHERSGDWRGFYDEWFADQGWQTAAGWWAAGGTCHAKFTAPDRRRSADVCLQTDEHGAGTGLLVISSHNIQSR